ncbi:PREDICTED: exosome complex component RRP43-like isoform X1 [Wasmannia auropunctata]|uniref:exosome complex component RRP43-like isoform X1 n=1 Tax=Wasmannia auropunctata TaxID=64793 RepID=UPI0005EE8682|nr:PREDICTED: exosome complex component RRP43-like isoform X1 [Wasmannia auropunctata]XP_011701668.1 PREDICTED: exosome complex component RRP43-like isoform X1 [Wasmannia auropunctata]XP_011701678.1 PREDICTED: exosome complex component RRP43-like isoform X1 [Wasmannia auropunctata]
MDLQYKTIHPMKYLQDHLEQDVRTDGRKFLSFRPISVNVSSIIQADSSAIFKVGDTTAVCGIKAELTTPKADTPDHGYIVPNVELSPLCSSKFRPGPPSEQAQVLSKSIDIILSNSAALDLTDLCICRGKLVWVLYCDILCLNYNGSVIDACAGALMAALKTLTLPEVNYNSETGVIVVHPKNRETFTVRTLPVSISFAVFEKQLLIVDPTDDEEDLSAGRFSIVMDDEEEICYVHKPGGIAISQNLLSKALEMAKARAKSVRSVINAAISTLNVNDVEINT